MYNASETLEDTTTSSNEFSKINSSKLDLNLSLNKTDPLNSYVGRNLIPKKAFFSQEKAYINEGGKSPQIDNKYKDNSILS